MVEKARHLMTLYRDGKPFRTFAVALGRGGLGPKQREGDNLTPEGSYRIIGRNPNSAYHLSLRVSYPEPRDVEAARARGLSPGSDIMIHGIGRGVGWRRFKDWTFGCIAVTDSEMEEIWRMVPDGTPIDIKP